MVSVLKYLILRKKRQSHIEYMDMQTHKRARAPAPARERGNRGNAELL